MNFIQESDARKEMSKNSSVSSASSVSPTSSIKNYITDRSSSFESLNEYIEMKKWPNWEVHCLKCVEKILSDVKCCVMNFHEISPRVPTTECDVLILTKNIFLSNYFYQLFSYRQVENMTLTWNLGRHKVKIANQHRPLFNDTARRITFSHHQWIMTLRGSRTWECMDKRDSALIPVIGKKVKSLC